MAQGTASRLRCLFALAGSGGAEVDEVAAVGGVVPDAGLVLRVVVEDHWAGGVAAFLEAGAPVGEPGGRARGRRGGGATGPPRPPRPHGGPIRPGRRSPP